MYKTFEELLGKNSAIILTSIIYAILILLVIYTSFEPQAELKYTAL